MASVTLHNCPLPSAGDDLFYIPTRPYADSGYRITVLKHEFLIVYLPLQNNGQSSAAKKVIS